MAAAGSRAEVDVESVQRLAYRLYEMTQKSPDDARLLACSVVRGRIDRAAGRVRLGAAVR